MSRDKSKQSRDTQWQKKLTPEQFHIMREKGTEMPFTGIYWNNHESGMYECAACHNPLFSSDAKFDSGTGWPSFDTPLVSKNIIIQKDNSLQMERLEVLCAKCHSHLGHLFPDGPKQTTGMRYCINSCALQFNKKA